MIENAGFVVEFENTITYGQTYLLKKAFKPSKSTIPPEDYKIVVEKIKSYGESWKHYAKGDIEKAIGIVPRFPEAWINLIFSVYGKDPEAQAAKWDEALAIMPENSRLKTAYGEWLFQHEKFDKALDIFNWRMRNRPGVDALFKLLGS